MLPLLTMEEAVGSTPTLPTGPSHLQLLDILIVGNITGKYSGLVGHLKNRTSVYKVLKMGMQDVHLISSFLQEAQPQPELPLHSLCLCPYDSANINESRQIKI
jgi:hypothetical protein